MRPSIFAPAAALVLAAAPAAQATVISGASDAFDATVDIEIPSLSVDVMEGPVTTVSGSAPPPYDLSDSETTGFAQDGVIFDAAVTATFSSSAASDVDGVAGVRTTDASGGIEDVTITLTVGTTELLRLEISGILGSASVTGEFGSLVASGSTAPIDVRVDTHDWNAWDFQLAPQPNEILLDNGVIQIVGNEQFVSCDGPVAGSDTCEIETNALHVYIDGTMNGSYTHGEIIVGHTFATMTAVPEPGTLLLVGTGLVVLAARRRR